MPADRRSRLPADGGGPTDWPVYLFIAAAVAVFTLLSPLARDAPALILRDPDNYMRIVQLRDWLGGQSWWDVTQYRLMPPEGLRMHWSRLADVPLAALVLLFSIVVERATAEVWAVLALPPVLLLFTLVFIGRAARHAGGERAEAIARIVAITVPGFVAQFLPGQVDHHALQLMLLAGALAAATGPETRVMGVLAALACALSLAIGLETAPLLAILAGWLALRWALLGETAWAKLAGFLAGMIVSLPLLIAVSVPPELWLRATVDEVGRGHLAVVVLGGSALLLVARSLHRSPGARLAALAIAGVAALAVLPFAPELAQAPYADLDPMLRRLWLDRITETASLGQMLREAPGELLRYVLFPLLATLAALAMLARSPREPLAWLLVAMAFAGLALTFWQVRANAMAAVPSILVVSLAVNRLHQARGIVLATIAAVVLNGWFGPAIAAGWERLAPRTSVALPSAAAASDCEAALARVDLDAVPPGLVLAGIDLGGPILLRSGHSVLASANHRGVEGNLLSLRALQALPERARRMLSQRGVDYVLYCRAGEWIALAQERPEGLAANMAAGRVPDWLEPVVESEAATLYRLR